MQIYYCTIVIILHALYASLYTRMDKQELKAIQKALEKSTIIKTIIYGTVARDLFASMLSNSARSQVCARLTLRSAPHQHERKSDSGKDRDLLNT